ncbi:NADPH oxidase family protein [Neptunomonas japonica]|nr:NADPH oxidase family protein [Neptunomonas japonica]
MWFKRYSTLLKVLPWLSLFFAVGSYQFWLGFDYNSNDTTNIYLRLARGSAYLLLLILAVMWLPVMRKSITVLRCSRWGRCLPLDQAKVCHRWLGHLLIVAALLHGSQYLLYYDTLEIPFKEALLAEEADLVRSMRTNMYEFVSEDESIDVMQEWIAAGAQQNEFESKIKPILKEDCTKCHNRTSTMTYAIPNMPLSHYEDVLAFVDKGISSRQFRINMSGLSMLFILLIVWLSSLQWVRIHLYHRFQQLHRLGYALALLALLHITTLQWIVFPLLVLVIELYCSRVRQRYTNCVAHALRVNEQVVCLTIERPKALALLPGHYVQLRIPALSAHEWHSFSLTGIRNDQRRLVLKISCVGDWTKRLQQMVTNAESTKLGVDVRGPYASPAAHAPASNHWLLIAGGIGITPFLSLLRECKRDPNRRGMLHLVWVIREPELLQWLRPLIERLLAIAAVDCHWHIYLTADTGDLSLLRKSFSRGASLQVQHGRPNWQQLTSDIGRSGYQPHCFICGPKGLSKEAGDACRRMGWPVRKESF